MSDNKHDSADVNADGADKRAEGSHSDSAEGSHSDSAESSHSEGAEGANSNSAEGSHNNSAEGSYSNSAEGSGRAESARAPDGGAAPGAPASAGADQPSQPAKAAAPAADAAPVVNAAPAAPPAPARSGSGAIAWLALLIALLIAAFGVWSALEAQRREADLLQRVQALESASGQDTTTFDQMRDNLQRKIELELEGLQSRQQRATEDLDRALARLERLSTEAAENASRNLARELEALKSTQDRQFAELGSTQAQLSSRLAEQSQLLSDLSVEDRESWQIAEVQYLLRLANQRLIMTGDTVSAEALLRSADDILRDLDSQALAPLRAAVARDLAAVRAVPRLDLQGLYLRVDALIAQTDELVLFELPEPETPQPMEASEDWRERLAQGYDAAVEKLSEYIVVSRRDVPIETLMDPQYEGLVRQNMRMLLEQAQVAMLSGNQTLYEQSLSRARGWVTQFFKDDAEAAAAMAEELSALAKEKISVELPDLNQSLTALESVVRQRLSRSGG